LWFVPLLVISLLVAMCLTIFLSPVIGIPLLLIAAVFGAIGWFNNNRTESARVEEFRDQAREGVEFTARDRDSLAESDPARR
jgi:hypothetical protein